MNLDKEDDQLQRLLVAVRELRAAVQSNDEALRTNVAATERVAQLTEETRKGSRRTRWGLMLTAFGLSLDLVISGVLIYQNERQSCFNTVSGKFFDAEKDKVQGQIAGKREERDAVVALLNRTSDPQAALAEFSKGTDDWIAASNHYLDTIKEIRQGGC